jgi:predicted permease
MIYDNALIIATQVFILFLLIGVGFVIRKIHMIDDASMRQVNNLLLVIVIPCTIVRSFQTKFDQSLVDGMLIALLSAFATHALGAVLARLVFRRYPPAQGKVLQYAVIFSNCVFICIPLLYAVLGNNGVLFGSVYIVVYNILSWTYGIYLISGNKSDINLQKALINPGTVAILIALPLFILQIRLPDVLLTVIGHLANLNTPLAMLIIGGLLASVSLPSIFRDKSVYISSALRLLAVPGLMLLVLSLFHLDRTVLLACLIPAMAPAGTVTALFATRYEQDAGLATKIITFSTLASILTMPLLILCSDLLNQ